GLLSGLEVAGQARLDTGAERPVLELLDDQPPRGRTVVKLTDLGDVIGIEEEPCVKDRLVFRDASAPRQLARRNGLLVTQVGKSIEQRALPRFVRTANRDQATVELHFRARLEPLVAVEYKPDQAHGARLALGAAKRRVLRPAITSARVAPGRAVSRRPDFQIQQHSSKLFSREFTSDLYSIHSG